MKALNDKQCPKATPEELVGHIRSASTGFGQSFELICRHCRDGGLISADPRTYLSKKHKLKAAERFALQGWRIEEGVPVCPRAVQDEL